MTRDMAALQLTRAWVHRGGVAVAWLRYAGPQVTVQLVSGPVAGRILPAGYLNGQPPGDLYDAWTALHPSVHTPGDQPLGSGLAFEDAVRLLLGET